MAVTAAEVEVPTAVVVASTGAALLAEVSMAGVATLEVAATMVEDIPTAAIVAVGEPAQCTALTGTEATTAGPADIRRPRAVSAQEQEGAGPRRPEVLVTPRRDGIRLEDQSMEAQAIAGAWLQVAQPALPTGSGTPSEAPAARLDRP